MHRSRSKVLVTGTPTIAPNSAISIFDHSSPSVHLSEKLLFSGQADVDVTEGPFSAFRASSIIFLATCGLLHTRKLGCALQIVDFWLNFGRIAHFPISATLDNVSQLGFWAPGI
ncbi:hypothetical protein L596_009435 [Steinernema carpocapsae]|uniref:Uncharacterized protein n=1 Tax=Steinernema carpocapsae TaxID=34508 RepID=A0A4U5PFI8_STECR|nr:hypothetical protein L596_009435 [Steinernema carpocapsae]